MQRRKKKKKLARSELIGNGGERACRDGSIIRYRIQFKLNFSLNFHLIDYCWEFNAFYFSLLPPHDEQEKNEIAFM